MIEDEILAPVFTPPTSPKEKIVNSCVDEKQSKFENIVNGMIEDADTEEDIATDNEDVLTGSEVEVSFDEISFCVLT